MFHFAALLLALGAQPTVAEEVKRVRYGSSVTHSACAQLCADKDLRMPCITDLADNERFIATFKANNDETAWLGYTQDKNAASATAGWSYDSNCASTFAPHWEQGEPNDYPTNEDHSGAEEKNTARRTTPSSKSRATGA
ncbi:hypothetical protein M885DRAFT_568906 [Pelagophyceae sp. CCMP2097]|nr:hypothetical protein M885DRAFT_568906 [Pelagophyceae sp. CCMP2097]